MSRCATCPAPEGDRCRGEAVPRLCELAATRSDYRRLLAGSPDPRALRRGPPPPPGPGTILKGMLGWVGIKATEGCGCADMAAKMDVMGCDWSAENIELIVDTMGAEAKRRGLPFTRWGATLLVTRAIREARSGEAP